MRTRQIIILTSILLILILSGCQEIVKGDPVGNNSVSLDDNFIIERDGNFSQEDCLQKGLGSEVLFIGSKYCGHCTETKPHFIKACDEANITPTILDLSLKDDANQVKKYSIEVRYTPTIIIGCNYYVGEKTEKEYVKFLDRLI